MMAPVRTKAFLSRVLIATVLFGAAGPAAAEPLVVVVPNGLESSEGNSEMLPCPPPILDGYREQFILSASQFGELPGPMWLTRIAWRPDWRVTSPLKTWATDYQIRLSTTSRTPAGMNERYADNTGPDDTLAFRGDVIFSSDPSGPPGGPREFDQIVDLQTPFLYDPAQGNLVFDHRYSTLSASPQWDAHNPGPGPFRWIYSADPSSPVGVFMGSTSHLAYVYQFTFVPEPSGDFDGDGRLNVTDIDMLTTEVLAATHSPEYDLNDDALVNGLDHRVWVKDLERTWFGDADLDGEFDSNDFVQVFQAGKYETTQLAGWAEGDWNGDGIFSSNDFVIAFQDGGYEQGPRTDVAAVPEPGGVVLLLTAACTLLVRLRRTRSFLVLLALGIPLSAAARSASAIMGEPSGPLPKLYTRGVDRLPSAFLRTESDRQSIRWQFLQEKLSWCSERQCRSVSRCWL